MKKALIITSMAIASTLMYGQDGENNLKNFRFGLKVSPSVNWYQPDGKIIAANGLKVGFGGGLITEFRLAKVVCIETGAQIDIYGGKLKYNNGGPGNPGANTVSYYYNALDDNIVKYNSATSSDTHYQLNERNYKTTYITIPILLKMKTKEIGALTYFGQIGINNSFRWKATANDELQVINDATNTLGAKESKSQVNITKDVSFYTGSLNFGLGGEMNLSGTTSLMFSLNYNLGFTNVVKNDSDYLGRRANDVTFSSTNSGAYQQTKMPQQVKSNAVVLTVGVLF
jgi:hypothetical protein